MNAAAAPRPAEPELNAALVALALRAAPHEGRHDTAVPGLQVIRADSVGARLPAVYTPGLVLVLQGRKQATLGERVLHYDSGHCLVVSVTMLPLAQITEATPQAPYLCLRLDLPPQELAELLTHLPPPSPPRGATAPSAAAPSAPTPPASAPPAAPDRATALDAGLHLAPVGPALLGAAHRLLQLLDAPHDLPVLAPLLQREIAWRALNGPLGPRLRALAVADSQAQRIARVIALLQERYREPLSVVQLAEVAHMSPSTLHQHFRQVTALSPLRYQKTLRLQEARTLMLTQGLDAASAAHQVGYESPSQFSREYRRLFGQPPRAEVDRLRAQAAPAG